MQQTPSTIAREWDHLMPVSQRSVQLQTGFAPVLNETSALPFSDFAVTSSSSTQQESVRKVHVPLENF